MNRKQILVTGASRGIGRAAALAFAREQDNLIITCQKNKELLDQVKQEGNLRFLRNSPRRCRCSIRSRTYL